MNEKTARSRRKVGQAVTIQAVATQANVSAMTVSHVLNGTKRVRDETRDAVLAAVEDLGYVPNLAARQLASANAIRIGIIYRGAQNAFLSAMLVGSLNAAARLGVQVLLRKCDTFERADAIEAAKWLIGGGANALLLNPPYAQELSESGVAKEFGIPISAIAQGSPLPGVDCVGIDEAAAATEMTEYLIGKGHRSIGFVTGRPDLPAAEGRLNGYLSACRKHGIDVNPEHIVTGDFSFDSGLAAGETLLSRADRPSAIFASNDDMAAGVSLMAHRLGLDVPEDVAIAGFDDGPIAVKIWPPLTTVRQDVEALAGRGVEMLVERYRSKLGAKSSFSEAIKTPLSEQTPHQLVVRESA